MARSFQRTQIPPRLWHQYKFDFDTHDLCVGFLHLHEIVEGLYFHFSLSVCLCVCLSVCVSDVSLWTKFQPNGWTDLDAVFTKRLLTALTRILSKLVTLGQRSWSQWRNNLFLHNSLLTSFFCFSALLYSIVMKFGMTLEYALSTLEMDYHKNWMGDDVLMT